MQGPDDPLQLKLVSLESSLIESGDFDGLARDVAQQAYPRP